MSFIMELWEMLLYLALSGSILAIILNKN